MERPLGKFWAGPRPGILLKRRKKTRHPGRTMKAEAALRGELENQWNGRRSLGHSKDTSQETQEPESFSARTDHLAWENAQKCQQQLQQHEAEGACRPPQAEGSSLSWWQ